MLLSSSLYLSVYIFFFLCLYASLLLCVFVKLFKPSLCVSVSLCSYLPSFPFISVTLSVCRSVSFCLIVSLSFCPVSLYFYFFLCLCLSISLSVALSFCFCRSVYTNVSTPLFISASLSAFVSLCIRLYLPLPPPSTQTPHDSRQENVKKSLKMLCMRPAS
jgi:hypothetical protein